MYSVLILAAMTAGDAAPALHHKGQPLSQASTWHSWGSCYGGCYGIGYTGWVGVGGWGHPHASTAGWGLPYGADAGWGAAYGGYAPAYAGHGGCDGYAGPAYGGPGAVVVPGTGRGPVRVNPLPPGYEVSRPAAPAAAGNDPSARLDVQLPEGAKLYVDDRAIANSGTAHSFRTPALEKGESYYYELRAEVERDGQVVSQRRRVVLAAGKTVTADFRGLGAATSATAAKR